ncbi:uncharacterized protein AB675_9493 [Cyphellophora attinorum]|uniref:F-box domain-containing protein n=1 Tax=Cyphellophora attinorum TaxID=1664694 RepID=A0A0N1HXD7_9EURO|nr:uncharacterized protein AB675_9493 [Phialophora attinorum]KPI42616.1 hypothetical protein AB675_9493 [Phialophora attinorum]
MQSSQDPETLIPSACHRVLLTSELLEAILLCLPVETILLKAQRISGTFRSAIQASRPLRQHLFFERDPASGEDKPRLNEVLKKRLLTPQRPLWKTSSSGVWTIFFGDAGDTNADRTLHLIAADVSWRGGHQQELPPFMLKKRRATKPPPPPPPPEIVITWGVAVRCSGRPDCELCAEHRALMESSSKDMYLAQPPCSVVFKFPHKGEIAYRTAKTIEKAGDVMEASEIYLKW